MSNSVNNLAKKINKELHLYAIACARNTEAILVTTKDAVSLFLLQ